MTKKTVGKSVARELQDIAEAAGLGRPSYNRCLKLVDEKYEEVRGPGVLPKDAAKLLFDRYRGHLEGG